jgi:hypothetical protein
VHAKRYERPRLCSAHSLWQSCTSVASFRPACHDAVDLAFGIPVSLLCQFDLPTTFVCTQLWYMEWSRTVREVTRLGVLHALCHSPLIHMAKQMCEKACERHLCMAIHWLWSGEHCIIPNPVNPYTTCPVATHTHTNLRERHTDDKPSQAKTETRAV